MSLLISASQVARITSVSHWGPATSNSLKKLNYKRKGKRVVGEVRHVTACL
jgi:hypothetical protein